MFDTTKLIIVWYCGASVVNILPFTIRLPLIVNIPLSIATFEPLKTATLEPGRIGAAPFVPTLRK